MNASGPFGVGAANAVSRVRKISVARHLYGERDANEDAPAQAQPDAPKKPASRSGTDQSQPLRHGLWRHAPFVAQIIGQILPCTDDCKRLGRAAYGEEIGPVAIVFDAHA
jgi:hypothetical protein